MNVRHRSGDARDEAVVAALRGLAPHLDGEPDPSFRATTRARLIAMAAVRSPQPEPVTGLKRLLASRAGDAVRAPWRIRLTAGLAGAALTVTAAASLVAISAGARPGDVLYGLKRGTEQSQLALAGDARGQTLLDFASTRLTELKELVDEPHALPAARSGPGTEGAVFAAGADPGLVISTLETMDDQTTAGTAWLTDHAVATRTAAPLDDLGTWLTGQTDGLASLAPSLPSAAGAAVTHSLTLLSVVAARVDALQAALSCGSGPAVGPGDALGPVPTACVPAATEGTVRRTATGIPDTGVPGTGVPGTGTTGTGTIGAGDLPSTTAVPTAPSADGSTATKGAGGGTGGGTLPGGVPVPGTTLPTRPKLPLPSIPGAVTSALPSLTLPGTGTGPLLDVPDTGGALTACLPPLATIGQC